MKRREFLGKAGLGSAAVATLASPGRARAATKTGNQHEHSAAISGPQATATVSFGAWASGVDRHPNLGATATNELNVHAVIPNEVQIKAGGTVNFIISGFHQVIVYGDGTRPGDIDASDTVPATVQPGPPLINDANNRVFRGIDPSVLPACKALRRDRAGAPGPLSTPDSQFPTARPAVPRLVRFGSWESKVCGSRSVRRRSTTT
jgi:plastocyanin